MSSMSALSPYSHEGYRKMGPIGHTVKSWNILRPQMDRESVRKFCNGRMRKMDKVQSTTKALFGVERNLGVDELLRASHSSFERIPDDQRLKAALKRAVRREKAPQRLISSIRDFIRG